MDLFGERIIEPDPNRPPAFDSEQRNSQRCFRLDCDCGDCIGIDLPSFVGRYRDRDKVLGVENGDAIRVHFNLPAGDLRQSGWPRFRVEECAGCGKQYLVYVTMLQPTNAWYRVVLQGITEIHP